MKLKKYLTPAEFGRMVGLPTYTIKGMLRANKLDHVLASDGTRMIAANARTPSAITVRRCRDGVREKRCASCYHWLSEDKYGKGKWASSGSKCMDCEASAQTFRLYRGRCPVLDAAYLSAIARDKDIIAARRAGLLVPPGEERIAQHAAAVAHAGASGDGRKWVSP